MVSQLGFGTTLFVALVIIGCMLTNVDPVKGASLEIDPAYAEARPTELSRVKRGKIYSIKRIRVNFYLISKHLLDLQ